MPKTHIALVAVLSALSLSACAYNETLGRNQFVLVDEASLTQQSDAAWAQALKTQSVSTNAGQNARVRTVGTRIVQAANLGDRSWDYAVFNDDAPNAFVLPSGKIGVTTALLALVQNDDQLATVIGHEVAHVVARHAAERNSTSALAGIAGQVAGGLAGDYGQQAASATGLFAQYGALLPFSRRDELEADRIGVDFLAAAGYRPSQAVALWRLMAAQGASNTPEFASTHPSDTTRIAALEQYIASRGWN